MTTTAVNAVPGQILLKTAKEGVILDLAVLQGLWTVEQYLRISDVYNRIIEFSAGVLEGPFTSVPDYSLVLDLDVLQGLWTPEQYLRLTDDSNRLIEFTNGVLEVLPMPTDRHQSISRFLLLVLYAYLQPRGGTVFYSPLRLQIPAGPFREPDLLLLLDANDPRRQNDYWRGADLVIEIVSPDKPERDTVEKRADYAEARIPEYWIVHPAEETITVLHLAGDRYSEHGVFPRGQTATSVLLASFAVAGNDVLDAR